MTLNQKQTGRAWSIPGGLAVSGAVSMLITLVVVAIGASLISGNILPQEQIGYCSMVAILAGSMTGAVTAGAKIKHRKMLVCLMSGAVYYMILLSITALIFDGEYQGMGVTLLLVLGGSVIGLFLTNREKGSAKPHRRKKIHR